jgi:hypothetical protein
LSYRFLPFNVADCFDFHDNNTPRESKLVIFNSGAVIPRWLSRHSQDDSNVTGGVVAVAALQKIAIAAVNIVRVIRYVRITLSLRCGEQKRQNPAREALANNLGDLRTSRQRKRFVAHTDEKLTAFLELESAICACGKLC